MYHYLDGGDGDDGQNGENGRKNVGNGSVLLTKNGNFFKYSPQLFLNFTDNVRFLYMYRE